MGIEYDYLLKVNVAFVLFYAFYRLSFYKDTFFKWRRGILLLFYAIAFIYPLVQIQHWIVQQEALLEMATIYVTMLPDVVVQPEAKSTDWTRFFIDSLWIVYSLGLVIYTIRLLIQLVSIARIRLKSTVSEIDGQKVYILPNAASPFSFFKMIFIHPQSHSIEETSEIMAHEFTHAKQMHTVDVLISEMVTIICWFNPFVWLLKREVRYNLEYLADQNVITAGFDTKRYQYHLLDLAQHSSNVYLYNSFNMLHLKNRILMMNKKRSTRIGIAKYMMFIPLTATIMLGSNFDAIASVSDMLVTEDLIATTETVELSGKIVDDNQPLTAAPQDDNDPVFTVVETPPLFPGGNKAMSDFLMSNINYPDVAAKNGIQGRVVCNFIVAKDGTVTDVNILRGVDPMLDAEAVRVLKSMPKWNPGKQRGKVVRVKYTIPVLFGLPSSAKAAAPQSSEVDDNQIFAVVQDAPKFPGGEAAMMKFISSNIKYPLEAFEKDIQGRVICKFIVEKDGSLTNLEVVRKVAPSLDAEAIRVIEAMPKWNPGRQRGVAVRVKYTLPVLFTLKGPKDEAKSSTK
jgi:TonB family protein